jgi:hypothetical protein
MATTLATPSLRTGPSLTQRARAAAAIRTIAALVGRPPCSHYACETCAVAWTGPEADCWMCGRPATDYSRTASTLQLLLRAVIPAAGRKDGQR